MPTIPFIFEQPLSDECAGVNTVHGYPFIDAFLAKPKVMPWDAGFPKAPTPWLIDTGCNAHAMISKNNLQDRFGLEALPTKDAPESPYRLKWIRAATLVHSTDSKLDKTDLQVDKSGTNSHTGKPESSKNLYEATLWLSSPMFPNLLVPINLIGTLVVQKDKHSDYSYGGGTSLDRSSEQGGLVVHEGYRNRPIIGSLAMLQISAVLTMNYDYSKAVYSLYIDEGKCCSLQRPRMSLVDKFIGRRK